VLVFVTCRENVCGELRNRDLHPAPQAIFSPGALSRSDVASPASANQAVQAAASRLCPPRSAFVPL